MCKNSVDQTLIKASYVFFARTIYSEIQVKEKDKESWPNFAPELKDLITKLQDEGRSEMKKENALVKSDRKKHHDKSKKKRQKRRPRSDSSSASSHPPTPSSAAVKKRKKKDKEVTCFCKENISFCTAEGLSLQSTSFIVFRELRCSLLQVSRRRGGKAPSCDENSDSPGDVDLRSGRFAPGKKESHKALADFLKPELQKTIVDLKDQNLFVEAVGKEGIVLYSVATEWKICSGSCLNYGGVLCLAS